VSTNLKPLRVRHLGRVDYEPTYELMQQFSAERKAETVDQLWLLEHSPVYTLGKAGKMHHVLNPGNIPLIQVDRGGQVTYHGPGQIVLYLLLDVRRRKLGVRQIVTAMENAIIKTLETCAINAYAKAEAPGVYVNQQKIASLGLRIKNGKSYHGLALNYDMDLQPFSGINPCGYEGLEVINLTDIADRISRPEIELLIISNLANELGYQVIKETVNE